MKHRCDNLKTYARRTDTAFRLLAAAPEGAASWYATFGPIAVFYQPGMWLIVPVAAGAAISITDEALEILHERYPHNRFIHALHSGAIFLNRGIGGFMADFGFMWSMVITTGVFIKGVDYAYNQFASLIAPLIALIPAAVARIVTYRLNQNERVPSLVRHAGFFFRGGAAPSEVLDAFTQQNLLAPNSIVPPIFISLTTMLGVSASLVKGYAPRLSTTLETLLIMLFENPSLAALAFNLPNDIYAALNGDEINDTFFFATAAFASLFLLLLTVTTALRPLLKDKAEDTHENDDISSDDEDDEEKYLFLQPSHEQSLN